MRREDEGMTITGLTIFAVIVVIIAFLMAALMGYHKNRLNPHTAQRMPKPQDLEKPDHQY